MPSIAGEMLEISADQGKQLDEIQKDIDAHLDKLLTADQKQQSAAWPRGRGNGWRRFRKRSTRGSRRCSRKTRRSNSRRCSNAPPLADRAAADPRADARSSAAFVMQPASPDSQART